MALLGSAQLWGVSARFSIGHSADGAPPQACGLLCETGLPWGRSSAVPAVVPWSRAVIRCAGSALALEGARLPPPEAGTRRLLPSSAPSP